jgi:hypothetical protein
MFRFISTLIVMAAVSGALIVAQPAPDQGRAPRNLAEFDELFQQVKNWGRWGPEDQRGAANLVTDAKRRQAADLVKTGLTVSLAHNPLTDKAEDNALPFEHTMNRGFTTDTYRVSYHGYAHSHIDALCHILYKDQTYNGYARTDINTEKGCTKLGIENLKQGIVTRGILLDIPRLKGLEWLEPGTPVYGEEGRREGGAGRCRAAAHRAMAAAREAGAVARGPQRRRVPCVRGALDESPRRRFRRQRRGPGRGAAWWRGSRCPCTRCCSRASVSICSITRTWKPWARRPRS